MSKNYDLCIESSLPIVTANGLNTNKNVDFTGATTVAFPAGTTIGGSSVSALGIITSASANALTVGPGGATNPSFNVDASTASAATGINIKSAAAGSGVAATVLSSGTNENLTLDAKGSGTVTVNGTATGGIILARAVTASVTLGVTGMSTLTGGLTGGTQALSGAGAVNLTTLITKVTSTGANALTLADGTDGQVKIIVMVVDGGDATLTPTTKTGFSTIVFNDAGDGVTLVFTTTTGWIVAGNNGATIS